MPCVDSCILPLLLLSVALSSLEHNHLSLKCSGMAVTTVYPLPALAWGMAQHACWVELVGIYLYTHSDLFQLSSFNLLCFYDIISSPLASYFFLVSETASCTIDQTCLEFTM